MMLRLIHDVDTKLTAVSRQHHDIQTKLLSLESMITQTMSMFNDVKQSVVELNTDVIAGLTDAVTRMRAISENPTAGEVHDIASDVEACRDVLNAGTSRLLNA